MEFHLCTEGGVLAQRGTQRVCWLKQRWSGQLACRLSALTLHPGAVRPSVASRRGVAMAACSAANNAAMEIEAGSPSRRHILRGKFFMATLFRNVATRGKDVI